MVHAKFADESQSIDYKYKNYTVFKLKLSGLFVK